MIVIADGTKSGEECKRSESSNFHNSFNANSNANNGTNSVVTYETNDFIERMGATNATTTTSVIDLEVDVHHRNSSGSSIGISSERSKSHSEVVNTSDKPISKKAGLKNNAVCAPNSDLICELNDCDVSQCMSHTNTASDANLTDKTNEMSELLVKRTSFELGFMAQDPAALRAQAAHFEAQTNRKRADAVVRRARSELETKCSSNDSKKISSLPPSHPVSLEVIGTTRIDSDSVNDVSKEGEDLRRRNTCDLNENISETNQHIIDSCFEDVVKQSSEVNENSPLLHDSDPIEKNDKELQVFEVDTSVQSPPKSSDCEDGDESDVSLVVNLNKVKKRKVQKPSKPRRAPNRRKVSKSCSSSKISNKKSEKVLQLNDSTTSSNDLNKRVQHYSSESDIESSHNGSDSYTSHTSTPLSSSGSSFSLSLETTPLTSSLATDNKSNASASRQNSLALEPKCIAGPSRQTSFEPKFELNRKISGHQSKSGSQDFVHNYVRNELHRKKRKSKKSEASAATLQSNDPEAANDNMAVIESSQNISADNGPPPYMLARILSTPGTHLAKSHEDTNVGAVHVFQDERGNWLTYTFDENSTGVARGLMNSDKALIDVELYSAMRAQAGHHKWHSSSSSSGSTVVLDSPANVLHTPKMLQTSLVHSQFGETSHEFSRVLQPNPSTLFADSFPSN